MLKEKDAEVDRSSWRPFLMVYFYTFVHDKTFSIRLWNNVDGKNYAHTLSFLSSHRDLKAIPARKIGRLHIDSSPSIALHRRRPSLSPTTGQKDRPSVQAPTRKTSRQVNNPRFFFCEIRKSFFLFLCVWLWNQKSETGFEIRNCSWSNVIKSEIG